LLTQPFSRSCFIGSRWNLGFKIFEFKLLWFKESFVINGSKLIPVQMKSCLENQLE
jgi:hypothetical protein